MTRSPLFALALLLAACGDKDPNPDDSGAEVDLDGDGSMASEDCDDEDPTAFPGNTELCDAVDNDCNGEVDDGVTELITWYADQDGDGSGNEFRTQSSCAQPSGYVAEPGDCDDADATTYLGADEVCDGNDNDCDGDEDEDAVDQTTWYRDIDRDGYGDESDSKVACSKPSGYTEEGGDCDDNAATAYPGATESCADGVDNDCSGDADCDDNSCLEETVCVPTVDVVVPSWGYYDSTTSVTIQGGGFDYKTVKSLKVTVGGVAATGVSVLDNSTLSAEFPPGTKGVADVVVSTDNGDGTLSPGFAWRGYGIYMADGKTGLAGNLYFYDTDDAAMETIGAIGYAVTGLAFDADNVLYAVQSTFYGGTSANAYLMTIDTASGAATQIGKLVTSAGEKHLAIADIVFVGDRLLGFSQEGDALVEIDPATAEVTVIGTNVSKVASGALAYDPVGGLVYLAFDKGLYSVDPSTGAATVIKANYGGAAYDFPNAMTWHKGVLWTTDAEADGGRTNLSTLDTTTVRFTRVFVAPDMVDAIASPSP